MPDGGYVHVWEDQLYQLHHELLDLGFAHHLFVTQSAAACEQASAAFVLCLNQGGATSGESSTQQKLIARLWAHLLLADWAPDAELRVGL